MQAELHALSAAAADNLDLPTVTEGGDHRLRITVGIASAGRSAILQRTIARLRHQTRPPDRLLLSLVRESDLGEVTEDIGGTFDILTGPAGLTRQRNAILHAARCSDLVVFFDDDFVPANDYLAQVEALFCQSPDIVMATGRVLADGILGPGIGFDRALEEISRERQQHTAAHVRDVYNVYGCNMVVRTEPVLRHDVWFDVGLPLYGWLEDVDFSRRLAPFGRIVVCPSMQGIHLGTKSGRQAGARLGYSQIANPIHLMRKGTMQASKAMSLMARNIGMNIIFAGWPEPFVDRVGRLKGNMRALRDLFLWRLSPHHILDIRAGEGDRR